MKKCIDRPTIESIVEQHIENAAFCWSRLQSGQWSPLYNKKTLQQYQRRLNANLEGIRLAGPAAIELSLAKAERWKTPDEIFVAMYVLLQNIDNDSIAPKIEGIEKLLTANPSAVLGASSAWKQLNPEALNSAQSTLLNRWKHSPAGMLRATVVDFLCADPNENIENYISSNISNCSPTLKATLLRVIAEQGICSLAPLCTAALNDPDPLCRFEASFSLVLFNHSEALPTLRDCLPLIDPQNLKRGLLLWATTSDTQLFDDWIKNRQLIESDNRDLLWAIAFRGERFRIKQILPLLNDNNLTLSAHVINHISGDLLEPRKSEESAEEEARSFTSESTHIEDIGLPEIDMPSLSDWLQNDESSCAEPTTMGLTLNEATTSHILETGSQPQRWQAALFISKLPEPTKWNHVKALAL